MKKRFFYLFFLFAVLKLQAQTSIFAVIDSLFAKGRYKQALEKLEKTPNSFEKYIKLANIYDAIDNYKQSIIALENALSFANDTNIKLRLAKNYQIVENYKKAIKIYEDVIAKDTLNLLLKYQLGKIYINTKKSEKAVEIFKNLIQKDDKNPNHSYYLGLAYAQLNDRDPMINSFIDTYKKDTTHIKAIEFLARSFQKLNDADSTQLFVDKGLQLEPKNDGLNRLKINHLYQTKDYKKALYYLHHLDSLPKNDTYVPSMLGRTYYQMDSLDLAKKYFNALVELDREDHKAHLFLGNIALRQKDYRTAEFRYRFATYIGKDQRDEEYYGLATVYFETEKPLMAIKMFEKAVEENGSNYKAAYQLAKLSDDYYKDKKIAYKLYVNYFRRFESRDKDITAFVTKRIQDIKTEYFMKGETLE